MFPSSSSIKVTISSSLSYCLALSSYFFINSFIIIYHSHLLLIKALVFLIMYNNHTYLLILLSYLTSYLLDLNLLKLKLLSLKYNYLIFLQLIFFLFLLYSLVSPNISSIIFISPAVLIYLFLIYSNAFDILKSLLVISIYSCLFFSFS